MIKMSWTSSRVDFGKFFSRIFPKKLVYKSIFSSIVFRKTTYYLVLLLLPIIIVSTILFGRFFEILKYDAFTQYETEIEYTKDAIDGMFYRLQTMSLDIGKNPKLTPFAIKDSIITQMLAIEELQNYFAFRNEMLSNVAIYYKGNPLLYSNRGTHYLLNFLSENNITTMTGEEFQALIDKSNEPDIFIMNKSKDSKDTNDCAIFYTIPLNFESNIPYRYAIYTINDDFINQSISSILKNHNSITILLDNNYEIITSTKKSNFHDLDFKELLQNNESVSKRSILLGDEMWFYKYNKSKLNGFMYLTLIPESAVMKPLSTVKTYFKIIIISVFFVGSLIIMGLELYNYKPIRRIKDFLMSILQENSYSNSKNDFDAIMQNISFLNKRSIVLRVQAIRLNMLKSFLQGQYSDINEFNISATEAKIKYMFEFFRVAVINFKSTNNMRVNVEDIITYIESNLPETVNGFGLENLATSNIVIIIASTSNDVLVLQKELEKIKTEIMTLWSMDSTSIAIGGCYKKTTDIPRSYFEALVSLDYSFVGCSSIVCYDDVKFINEIDVSVEISNKLQELESFIHQGIYNDAYKCITNICNKFISPNSSIISVRYIYYSIIYAIMKVASNKEHNLIIQNDYLEAFMFSNTAKQFIDLIGKFCFEVCEAVNIGRESHNKELKDKALKYVHENFHDYDFSIQNMAENLHVSSCYLSRYFKDQMGVTITDYVIIHRINEAKLMLRTTDEPIRSIISKIGYINETSFVRMFKKIVGITPGLYRKNYSELEV